MSDVNKVQKVWEMVCDDCGKTWHSGTSQGRCIQCHGGHVDKQLVDKAS